MTEANKSIAKSPIVQKMPQQAMWNYIAKNDGSTELPCPKTLDAPKATNSMNTLEIRQAIANLLRQCLMKKSY